MVRGRYIILNINSTNSVDLGLEGGLIERMKASACEEPSTGFFSTASRRMAPAIQEIFHVFCPVNML